MHTLDSTLAILEFLANPKVRTVNHWASTGDNQYGVALGDNQYGVALGDIRKVAAAIKSDDALALELWSTGNLDARLVFIVLLKPQKLSPDEMNSMVESLTSPQAADWFNAYLARNHPPRRRSAHAGCQRSMQGSAKTLKPTRAPTCSVTPLMQRYSHLRAAARGPFRRGA